MSRRTRLTVLLAAVLPLTAFAEVRQNPGLWEATVKIESPALEGLQGIDMSGVDLGSMGIQLPPGVAQQAIGQQGGLQLPKPGEPVVRRFCVTKAQVTQDAIPDFNDPSSGCRTLAGKRDGDTLNATVQCNGQLRGSGTVEMTLHTADLITGSGAFTGSALDGGFPIDMTSTFTGKWVSADCGNVAPMR